MYRYVLLIHVLGATVWAGGHLVLALWLPRRLVPFSLWLSLATPVSRMLAIKFTCLAATIGFAFDARLRVLPKLRDESIRMMVPHISAVTTFAVLFVIAGVGIRTGVWS